MSENLASFQYPSPEPSEPQESPGSPESIATLPDLEKSCKERDAQFRSIEERLMDFYDQNPEDQELQSSASIGHETIEISGRIEISEDTPLEANVVFRIWLGEKESGPESLKEVAWTAGKLPEVEVTYLSDYQTKRPRTFQLEHQVSTDGKLEVIIEDDCFATIVWSKNLVIGIRFPPGTVSYKHIYGTDTEKVYPFALKTHAIIEEPRRDCRSGVYLFQSSDMDIENAGIKEDSK